MRPALVLLAVLAVLAAMVGPAVGREKRQARIGPISCNLSPSGVDDKATPSKQNDMITVNCPTSEDIESCIIAHTEPMNVKQGSGSSSTEPDTKCSASADDDGKSCDTNQAIRFHVADRQCGFTINDPKPEDTGKWYVTVVTIDDNSMQVKSQQKTLELFTYNQSTVEIYDKDEDDFTGDDYDVWFNWDQNDEAWRGGTGGYEKVELTCAARGGRPAPTIYWTINGKNGEMIDENDDHDFFNVRNSINSGYDRDGYIEDTLSEIDIDINDMFLDYLSTEHQIDVNPSDEQINFDLECVIEQGQNGVYYNDDVKVQMNVRKAYFKDAMKGETIGMIVGIVLAVVVVVLVVVLLLFAKARNMWCFDDDDYGYNDPRAPRSKPRTQAQ